MSKKQAWQRLLEDCARLGVKPGVNQLIRLVERGEWTDDDIVKLKSGSKDELKKAVEEMVQKGLSLDDVYYALLEQGIVRSPATVRSVYYKVLSSRSGNSK